MIREKSNNLVMVTGGSRGLGKALLELYGNDGWSTLDLSRSGTGERHLHVDLGNLDVSLGALETHLQTLAQSYWERVVFINNAGLLTPIAPVYALADAQIEQNLAVNLISAIRIMSAFARAFKSSHSGITVANISSGAALKGYAGWPLYCASKAGMENFIRSLAAEQNGAAMPMICINIEPGVIDTAMQAEIRAALPENFPERMRFVELKNSGQLRSPSVVARAIADIIDGTPENGGRYRVADYV